QVSGNEVLLKIQPAGATFPSWWDLKNIGACRQTSLGFAASIQPGAVSCLDWSNGNATGGTGGYQIGFAGPNIVRFAMAAAVPPTDLVALVADKEYFACALTINHAKTVGTGACAGCGQPMCIVIEQLTVDTPAIENNVRLIGGAGAPDSQFARWQNG